MFARAWYASILTPMRCILTSAQSNQILTFVGSLMSVAQ